MTLKETVENKIKEVEFVKLYAERQLIKAPHGTLKFRYEKGKLQYYNRLSNNDKNGSYIRKNTSDLIISLQYKEYWKKLIKVLAKEESLLKKLRKLIVEMPKYENVFLSIPMEKRNLITPFEYRDVCKAIYKEKISEWKRMYKIDSSLKKLSLLTQNGEYVRSKSELIIADRLKAADVPYVYESNLTLDTRTLKPDFMVLNIRTGTYFYWEHFGMLDDPDYCAKSISKIETYGNNGYYPGKNLIITMESRQHPLTTVYIDSIINEFLK